MIPMDMNGMAVASVEQIGPNATHTDFTGTSSVFQSDRHY